MFSYEEQRKIELKAIEQAIREAHVAKIELEPLLPAGSAWPFPLEPQDIVFLRVNKISPA